MIKANAKIRNEFAGCSTTNNYVPTKGQGLVPFERVLESYGLRFADTITQLYYNEGRSMINILDVFHGDIVTGCAVMSWYRMGSGRYEFTGYLA